MANATGLFWGARHLLKKEERLEKLGIKATLYDVLGYMVPGVVLLFGLWFTTLSQSKQTMDHLLTLVVTWPAAVMFLSFSYLAGHTLASLSASTFENPVSKFLISLVYDTDVKQDDARSLALFGTTLKCTSTRLLASYGQVNYPEIYESALIYLAMSGFSRNAAAAVIVISCYWGLLNGLTLPEFVSVLVVTLLLFYNYLRFKKNYKAQLASALLIVREVH